MSCFWKFVDASYICFVLTENLELPPSCLWYPYPCPEVADSL